MASGKHKKEINANTLLSFRKRHQLTQLEVAIMVGVSVRSIDRWEKGKGSPSLINLLRISKIYNTTPDLIYSDFPGKQRKIN